MRFFAIHDPDGSIAGLVGSPPSGPVMKPVHLAVSQLFSEVELPPDLFDPSNEESYRRLADVPARYVVKLSPGKRARLVEKSDGDPGGRGLLEALSITPDEVTRPQVPRFDVVLKEQATASLHVTLVLDPNTFLGSLTIPAGQSTIALSSPVPASVAPGSHVVMAIAGPDDIVTAKLTVN